MWFDDMCDRERALWEFPGVVARGQRCMLVHVGKTTPSRAPTDVWLQMLRSSWRAVSHLAKAAKQRLAHPFAARLVKSRKRAIDSIVREQAQKSMRWRTSSAAAGACSASA